MQMTTNVSRPLPGRPRRLSAPPGMTEAGFAHLAALRQSGTLGEKLVEQQLALRQALFGKHDRLCLADRVEDHALVIQPSIASQS